MEYVVEDDELCDPEDFQVPPILTLSSVLVFQVPPMLTLYPFEVIVVVVVAVTVPLDVPLYVYPEP